MTFCYFFVSLNMINKKKFEGDVINMIHSIIDEIKSERKEKHLTTIRSIFIPIVTILNSCVQNSENKQLIKKCLDDIQEKLNEKLNENKNNELVADVVKILDRICLTFTDKNKSVNSNFIFEKLEVVNRHFETVKY